MLPKLFAVDDTSLSFSPSSLIFPTSPRKRFTNPYRINPAFVYALLSWAINSLLVVIIHSCVSQIPHRK